jgi:hypothetical protein
MISWTESLVMQSIVHLSIHLLFLFLFMSDYLFQPIRSIKLHLFHCLRLLFALCDSPLEYCSTPDVVANSVYIIYGAST